MSSSATASSKNAGTREAEPPEAGRHVAAWLIPALAYVPIVGALGVVSTLALRDLSWQQLTLWTTLVYMVAAALLVVRPHLRPRRVPGIGAAFAAGTLAVIALVVLFVALAAGEVSQVVPVTAAYPALTLILAFTVLGERVSRKQIGGTILVIAGVIILSLS